MLIHPEHVGVKLEHIGIACYYHKPVVWIMSFYSFAYGSGGNAFAQSAINLENYVHVVEIWLILSSS